MSATLTCPMTAPPNPVEDRPEQSTRDGNLRHLEHHVAPKLYPQSDSEMRKTESVYEEGSVRGAKINLANFVASYS